MKNVYATAGLAMMLVILASEVKRVDPFIVMMLFCIGGAVIGVVAFRNSTFCVWLTGALLAITGVGAVLARWVLAVDPMRDSGTIPLPAPVATALEAIALGILWVAPFTLGAVLVIGFRFRHEQHGWVRLAVCGAMCGATVVIAPWIMGVAFD